MALISSFIKTVVVLVALAACAFALAPPQDSAAQKSDVRKRIVDKRPEELEAAATSRVEPVYPAVARWAGAAGVVGVRVLINEQGEVIDASAEHGEPLLKNAAVVAARDWKFKPVEVDGTPVKMNGMLNIKFLADASQPPSAAMIDDDIDKAKEAVRLFPNSAEAYYWLGTEYSDDDQNKEAEKAFKTAIELKPDYEEAYIDLIELYSDSKASTDVLRTYQQAIDKIPNSLKLLADYARKLVDVKRAADTVKIAKRAIEINPDDLTIRHILAWAYMETHRYEDALAELLLEVKLDPRDPLTHQYLAGAYHMLKRYEEALAAYRHIIAIKPDYYQLSTVYRDIGMTLLQLRRPQEAIEAFNQAVELKGKENVPDIHCGLSSAYLMLSRFEETLQALKKGIEAQPNDACLQTNLGIAQANMGKFAEAEQGFRKAVELQPTPEVYFNLIRVLMEQKKVAETEQVMRQALKRLPDNVQLHLYFGSILGQLGKQADADAELKEALRLDPNNALVLNNLGYSLVERGEKLNEALEMIQRAVNIDPNNSAYLDSLGWAYFKLGRLDEAERYLNRAIQGSYKSPAIYEHLGDIYEKQGKRELAIGAWQKALALAKDAKDSSRLKAKLSGEPPKEK
jgi:TonB family protein